MARRAARGGRSRERPVCSSGCRRCGSARTTSRSSTIAFGEIVRYVATNEDSLTGGSQGTIALGKVGDAAQYNGQWERFQARSRAGFRHLARKMSRCS